jgi:hypothetical protein
VCYKPSVQNKKETLKTELLIQNCNIGLESVNCDLTAFPVANGKQEMSIEQLCIFLTALKIINDIALCFYSDRKSSQ